MRLRRRFLPLIFTGVLISLSLIFWGCAPGEYIERDLDEVYFRAVGEGIETGVERLEKELKIEKPYGYYQPYKPVRIPPDVRQVWVAPHLNREGHFVGGHWLFIEVSPGGWDINFERPGEVHYKPAVPVDRQAVPTEKPQEGIVPSPVPIKIDIKEKGK